MATVDCSTALAAQTGWGTAYPYNNALCLQQTTSAQYKIINPNGWSDLFTNTHPIDCPIDACTLHPGPSCTGSVVGNIAQLNFDKNTQLLELGIQTQGARDQSDKFCVSCNVLGQPSVNFVTGNYAIGDMIDNKSTVHNICLNYSQYDGSTKGWGDYMDYFTNPLAHRCKPECGLYNSDCNTPFPDYTGSQVWMTNSPTIGKLRYKINTTYNHHICIKCTENAIVPNIGTEIQQITKTQEQFVTVSTTIDCTTSMSANTDTPSFLTTNLVYDDSQPGQFFGLDNFTGFTSWDDYFNNNNIGCCPITHCVLRTSPDSGVTWPTVLTNSDYVYMDGNFNILARKDIVEGYSIEFKVECQNQRGAKVEDTRFQIIQAAFDCNTYTCTSPTLNDAVSPWPEFIFNFDFTLYNGNIARQTPSDTWSSPAWVSWDEFFGVSDKTKLCCPITDCLLYQKIDGCTIGDCHETSPQDNTDLVYLDNNANGYKIKARYSLTEYSHEYKIVCSNDIGDQATGTQFRITMINDCTGSFTTLYPDAWTSSTPILNINFDYDAAAELAKNDYHVTAQFGALYNSTSKTFDWDTHFNNQKAINCPITNCWLRSEYNYLNMTDPVYMDAATKLIYARHKTGGTYVVKYRVACENQDESVQDQRFYVRMKVDCRSSLSDRTSSGISLNYKEGQLTQFGYLVNLEPIPPTPEDFIFTNWVDFFPNSDPENCPVECDAYENDCTTPHPYPLYHYDHNYDLMDIKTNHVSSLNDQICVKCWTKVIDGDASISGTARLQNWQIIIKSCDETLLLPSDSPQSISFLYLPGGASVQIFPDSLNKTWLEYFQSNQRCAFSGCGLYQGGSCTSGTFEPYSGHIQINQHDPWEVIAPTSVSAGYSTIFCVACSTSTPATVFWDNWQVDLIAKECEILKIQSEVYFLDIGQPFKTQLSSHFDVVGKDEYDSLCSVLSGTVTPTNLGISLSDQEITFDTSQPSILEISITLSVTNQVLKSATNEISFFVCGNEMVNLTTSESLVKTFDLNSGSNFQQVIEKSSFVEFFESTKLGCNVTNYRLIEILSTGEIIKLEDEQVSMGSDFEININTSQAMAKNVRLEASTKNSNNTAILNVTIYVQNFAPYFKDGSPEHQMIQFDPLNANYSFPIPEVVDGEDIVKGNFTITVSNLDKSFMIFDDELNEIKLFDITNETSGNYTIKVTLEDSLGKSSSHDLTFEILPIIEEKEEEESDDFYFNPWADTVEQSQDDDEETDPLKICRAIIIDLNFFGLTTIHFSQKMRTDFDVNLINEDVLNVYVKPAKDRHLLDPSFDPSSIELTWKPHSFKDQDLLLSVTFKNARAISPLVEQDTLIIEFKNITWPIDPINEVIYAEQIGKTIDNNYRVLGRAIQRQLEDTTANRDYVTTTEKGKRYTMVALVFSFLINLVMAGAFGYMLGWINTLQLIIHLPLMKILVPANVNVFFQTIIPIVTFDLIPPEWSTEFIMEFEDFPSQPFQDKFDRKFFGQMQDLGYDSHNSVQILGSLWIFSVLYFLRVMIYLPLIKLLSIKFKKLVAYKIELKNNLFIGEWVTISLEAYFEFLIAGYLNVSYNLDGKSGEYIGYYTSFYSLIVAIILMPAIMIYILCQPIEKIREESFKQAYGSFYAGMKLENKWQIGANMIFMMRRAGFIALCFNLDNIPGIQLISVNLMNLLLCIYYCGVKPLDTRFKTHLDLFNEFSIFVVTWHIMFFSDYIQEPDTQYLIGWSMVSCICFNGLVNIMIALFFGGRILGLILIKYYRICDFKLDQGCLKFLQRYNQMNAPTQKECVPVKDQILNILKDPFKVELSQSDEDEKSKEESEDSQELKYQRELQKIAVHNCNVIMASVINKQRRNMVIEQQRKNMKASSEFSFMDQLPSETPRNKQTYRPMPKPKLSKDQQLNSVLYNNKYKYHGQQGTRVKSKLKQKLIAMRKEGKLNTPLR